MGVGIRKHADVGSKRFFFFPFLYFFISLFLYWFIHSFIHLLNDFVGSKIRLEASFNINPNPGEQMDPEENPNLRSNLSAVSSSCSSESRCFVDLVVTSFSYQGLLLFAFLWRKAINPSLLQATIFTLLRFEI